VSPKARDERARVLVVDDHLAMAETTADGLADRGFDAVAVDSGRAALELLEREPFAALVTDLRMPGVDGLELLAASRRIAPDRPVIVMTAHGAVESAVESIRRGAYHYLAKPFKLDELVIFLERALDEQRVRREATSLRRTFRAEHGIEGLVGRSEAMRAVVDVIQRVADADMPVLLLGETGTGKGVVARALHAAGSRAERPFVSVNCAALPEALLDDELFGHVRGAFTGATGARDGLFVAASGGTLFLDEVGEMSPALQAKLLTAIEARTVRPIGSSREVAVSARILAATHRDLHERVRAGAFREDLLYRLDVVPIELPALRHRQGDVPALVAHFLADARARHPTSPVERFSAEAMARLLEYAWPGNVRELGHVVERAVVLGRAAEVPVEALPAALQARPKPAATFGDEVRPMREVQREYAAFALERFGGNKSRAAQALGVDVKTLAKWVALDAKRTRGEDED
jgi:two-component system response regulator HydG